MSGYVDGGEGSGRQELMKIFRNFLRKKTLYGYVCGCLYEIFFILMEHCTLEESSVCLSYLRYVCSMMILPLSLRLSREEIEFWGLLLGKNLILEPLFSPEEGS